MRAGVLGSTLFLLVAGLLAPARAQDTKVMPDSADVRQELDWNEFDLGWTSFRVGMAAIFETSAYQQNATGKAQMDSANAVLDRYSSGWRDFRFFANGRLRTERPII